jgi:hypothetical protein
MILYFRAVKFLFFPRRDLNPHHWYTAHHSLSLTSSALDHSTTSTPLKRSFNNRSVTFSRKANLGIDYIKNCWVRLLSNYNIKYICTIYTRLYTCLTSIPRFALREKVTLRLLKLLFLKIKPTSVRIRFVSCQFFVLPSTGFELTPLIHCSTIRLALHIVWLSLASRRLYNILYFLVTL